MSHASSVTVPAAICACVLCAALGCKSTQPPPADANAGTGPHIIVASPSASDETVTAEPPAASPPSAPDTNPFADGGFACAPTEPIKSTDPCTSSTDCAPSAPCHAPQCVDKRKAPVPPDGGAICTMSIVCKTADVGRCDCVDGVCALVAR